MRAGPGQAAADALKRKGRGGGDPLHEMATPAAALYWEMAA